MAPGRWTGCPNATTLWRRGILAGFESLHTSYLRQRAFREATGIDNVCRYRARRTENWTGRDELLRTISYSNYGFLRGMDLLPVLKATNAV